MNGVIKMKKNNKTGIKVKKIVPAGNRPLPVGKTQEQFRKENKKHEYLFGKYFPKKSISYIFGEAGVGKTFLIIDFAIRLGAGGIVFGKYECSSKKVLFFEGDLPEETVSKRVEQLNQNDNSNVVFFNRFENHDIDIKLSLTTEQGKEDVEKLVQYHHPDVLFFDTLISFVDNEQSTSSITKSIDFLRKLANTYNCHIVICHHTRKPKGKDKLRLSDMFGASAQNRLAGLVIAVDRVYEGSVLKDRSGVISVLKSWHSSIDSFEYTICDIENDAVEINYDYDYVDRSSKVNVAKKRILEIFAQDSGAEFSITQLVTQLIDVVSRDTVIKALNMLEQEGSIKNNGLHTNAKRYLSNDPDDDETSV